MIELERPDLRIVAEFAAHALWLGLINPAKPIAWADSIIEKSETPPPPWLIDLATADPRDMLSVRSALLAFPGAQDSERSFSLLNGLICLLWRERRLSVFEIRDLGYRINDCDLKHSRAFRWLEEVNYEAIGVDCGWMTISALETMVDDKVEPFAEGSKSVAGWASA